MTRSSTCLQFKDKPSPHFKNWCDEAFTVLAGFRSDDYNNVPPAEALAKRGIGGNIRGYSIYGDYSEPNPPSALIRAVEKGEIDVAIAWGPLAGYFAGVSDAPLEVVPVSPQIDPPFLPFVFDIAMGVRREDDALRVQLDENIERRSGDIHALLARY